MLELASRDITSPEVQQRLQLALQHVKEAHNIMQVDRIVLLDAIHTEAAKEKEQIERGLVSPDPGESGVVLDGEED